MDLIIGLQRRRVTCCVLCILWVVCTKGASYQGFRGMPIHPKAILYLLVLMTRPQLKKNPDYCAKNSPQEMDPQLFGCKINYFCNFYFYFFNEWFKSIS